MAKFKTGSTKEYDFHRQKPIDNYIVDFFCNKLKLAIEVDGYTHQFEEVIIKDKIKEQKLNELGIYVLRFNDEEVMKDIDNVIRVIEKYMDEFESESGHPPNPSRKLSGLGGKCLRLAILLIYLQTLYAFLIQDNNCSSTSSSDSNLIKCAHFVLVACTDL